MGKISFERSDHGTPDNSIDDVAAKPDIFSAVVINVAWWQLQPTRNALDTSVIQDALNAVRAYNSGHGRHPLRVKLRVWPGPSAPDWVKRLDGDPVTVIRNSTGGRITIGRFWAPSYRRVWRDLQSRLASLYDAEPLVAEVSNSSCGSQTDEPFITTGDSFSVGNLHAAGLTDALYEDCLMDSIQDYTGWATTRIDFAFSPFKHTDGQPFADVDFTLKVMNTFRAALGQRAVLSQHSMNSPVSATLAPIYDHMQSLGPIIEFQTHSPKGLDWAGAIRNAIGYGADAVELWNGATGFGRSSASVLQAWANTLSRQPSQ